MTSPRKPIGRRQQPKKLSAKREKALAGRKVYSTITPKADAKRVRKVNPEREAKRRKRQRSKHAKYMASPTRKIVDERANGRCEGAIQWRLVIGATEKDRMTGGIVGQMVDVRDGWEWQGDSGIYQRCGQRDELAHHHRCYSRYGGDELPEDVLKLCPRCHAFVERVHHPTRKNGRG